MYTPMGSVFALLSLAHLCVASVISAAELESIHRASHGFWTAGAERSLAAMPRDLARARLGLPLSLVREGPLPAALAATSPSSRKLPESFDARVTWPLCTHVIERVQDQGACGSCWAVAAAGVMSDRECIVGGHPYATPASAEDINSCATSCGGCRGGSPSCAFEYYVHEGVVGEDCLPYSIPPCDHHPNSTVDPCSDEMWPTPTCRDRCMDPSKQWMENKKFGSKHYTVSGERNIMEEVFERGPCVVGISVYQDLYAYEGGIYRHVYGNQSEGGHALRLIGWGVEQDTPYWLLTNSWNENWGEKGHLRILRGANECGVESTAWCGLPRVF